MEELMEDLPVVKLGCCAALTIAAAVLLTRLIMGPAKDSAKVEKGEGPIRRSPTPEGLLGLIKTRRSIFPKDYTGDPVPDDIVHEILDAANWAPTHGKTEPWRFVVIKPAGIQRVQQIKRAHMTEALKDDAEKLEAFTNKHDKKQKVLLNCSHMIAICFKRVENSKGKLMPEWEEIAAVSCAVQNMHLQLTAQGGKYGGYWSSGGWDSWLECPEMRQMFGMTDEGDRVLGLFHLGVAGESAEKYRAKRGDIGDKVTYIG